MRSGASSRAAGTGVRSGRSDSRRLVSALSGSRLLRSWRMAEGPATGALASSARTGAAVATMAPSSPAARTVDALIGLIVPDQGLDRIATKSIPALEEPELDQEGGPHHLASQPLHEPQGGRHGAPRGQEIVDHQYRLAGLDGVLVDREDVAPVLELVLLLDGRARQLAPLAHGDKARLELVGQRPAEDEAARLHPHDDLDRDRMILLGEVVDHRRPGGAILQERGDVLEEDALGGKVFDIADLRAEVGHVHRGRGCYP